MTDLRNALLANKPTLHPFEFKGNHYFIREFNVGEMNKAYYGQRQELIKLAKEQGIELHFDNEEELTKQLAEVYDPLRLARSMATRICDADGNNLFDVENPEDLIALSQLDKSVFEAFNQAIADLQPKNSPTDASSK
ncbi:hypothetical protein [Lonepinella sp. MS14436]|uniref:hypothetical protein n=1 Tax=Lonepinella sp. MS14436 TaxID=3003619 RepID=UPI0036D96C72